MYPLSFTDCKVIETDPLLFLNIPWKISLSLSIAVFKCSNTTPEKRFKGCEDYGIKFLMSEHLCTLEKLLIKFIKFLTIWIVSEKFKWSHVLLIQRYVMFLLSTISILIC